MKSKLVSFFSTLSLLVLCNNTFADLHSDIDRMIGSAKLPVHIGIAVRQLATGKIIYAHDSQYLFAPASIQKVVTATAALLLLGKDFRFTTQLLIDGTVQNGVLNGNVAVKFTGDPELTSNDLQQLVSTLSQKGIKRVNGNVYIDSSTYDQIPYPPGWLWDDLSYSYAAPLSAVNINKNKFTLHIIPGKTKNERPTLSASVPNGIINFENNVTAISGYNKLCPLTIYSDLHNNFSLHGCINKDVASYRSLAMRNTIPYAAALIQKFLVAAGVQHSGKILSGIVNNNYHAIGIHYSLTLEYLLKHMLKKSDNLISDSLVKQIGYQTSHQKGSWLNGKLAIESILHKYTGLDFTKALIDDGAGMSRYNLLSPNQFLVILDFIYRQPPEFRNILIDALPIGGIDGTLIGRFYKEAAEKRIHAKTGSMTGVSSLTGYIYSRHLGVLTFSIMINGFLGKPAPYRYLEDRICEYLAHYPGNIHG